MGARGLSLQPDFRAAFLGLSSPYMILDRDLRYVEVNAAYERATGQPRGRLIGRYLFDIFPNDDEPGQKLAASFRKVLETGEPDTLAFLRYDIPRPGQPGVLDARFWTAVHTPLAGPDGEVAFIVQNTVDVTELRTGDVEGRLRLGLRADVALLERAREAEAAKEAASRDASDLRRVFGQAPHFMAVMSGPAHVFTFANDAYLRLIGGRSVLGRPVREALPEIEGQGHFEMLDSVLASGEPVMLTNSRILLSQRPDAPPVEAWIDFSYHPVFGPDGLVTGVLAQGVDRTESQRGLQHQRLLVDELNHRVKNTLATVQSIALQTLKGAGLPKAAWEGFEGRLLALSRAHNLLSRANWSASDLRAVLEQVLSPYPAGQYELSGPPAMLSPRAALALSLVFHELATNSVKYGALSTSAGRISIAWSLGGPMEGRAAPGSLNVAWRETGRPASPVEPTAGGGFGSRLKQRTIEGELSGAFERTISADGFSLAFTIPHNPAAPA